THSEISSLTEAFDKLKIFNQTKEDYEIEMKEILETIDFFLKAHENNDEEEINEELIVILDQQEKEVFIHKLCTTLCCKTKSYLTNIDHESAFKTFDNIRGLTKAEYNIFLLGTLHAMIRPNKTLRSKDK
ncbi:2187_t:CDS:2, partial [Gigaspora margarita]